jgi:hypothetical protein
VWATSAWLSSFWFCSLLGVPCFVYDTTPVYQSWL